MEFEINEQVFSTEEAFAFGAVERQRKAVVRWYSQNPELIWVQVKGERKASKWHRSFWAPARDVIPEREDMWGERS